jgi:hypothetical protein
MRPGDNTSQLSEETNIENIDYWEGLFSSNKIIYDHKETSTEELISSFEKFINNDMKGRPFIPEASLYLIDHEMTCLCDFARGDIKFIDGEDESSIGRLYSEDLSSFFRFPWGGDTLNITSCFDVINQEKWRQLLIMRDTLYER